MNATRTVSFAVLASFLGLCLANSLPAAGPYTIAVFELGPTHFYPLDEVEPGIVLDAGVVGGIDGMHEGAFPPAQVGAAGPPLPGFDPDNAALAANGAGAVLLGPGSAFATDVMSIAFWFRSPNNIETGDRLFTNNLTRFGLGDENAFQVVLGVGDDGGLVVANGQETFHQRHLPPQVNQVKNDQWHHVVVVRNGDDINNVTMVVDGVDYSAILVPSSATWGTDGSDAHIAARFPTAASVHTLNGAIDEVAIWLDRALTVEEAMGLHRAAVIPEPSSVALAIAGIVATCLFAGARKRLRATRRT
jgi:hypothetical protein